MDLVHVGQFVVPYLLNPITCGHETYTIIYSKIEACNDVWNIVATP